MDEQSDTPDVITAVVVEARQKEAWELRLEGQSLSEIADFLGYSGEDELAKALTGEFKRQAQYMTTDERNMLLKMELDRLDRLQAKLWPSAMTGDEKSIEMVLKIMDRRIKILQLDAVDTTTNAQTVLVIGGNERAYIDRLKELAE